MAKVKYCEVGKHEVSQLWHSRKVDKATGDVIQQACCKACMARTPIASKPQRKKDDPALKVFFAEASLVFPDNCENCGEPLDNSSSFARKAQTCHILPKTKNGGFPTVAAHPSNKIFMCCFHGCHGHGKYDHGDAKTRQGMQVYEKAIERFKSLENYLSIKDRIKAYKYLGLDISELL